MNNRITYSDRFSMEPHKGVSTDEFMLIGHFKKEYLEQCIENHELARRTNENVIPDYLVYECDSLSLEEQLKIIDALDHSCIRYITFSGSKSYHVLFKIKVPGDITNEEYKEIWKDVMDYYHIREYADAACANKSRLTRNPNGFRRKYIQDESGKIKEIKPTRTRQTCIYDNPDCETLDLTENVKAIREQAALNRAWEEKCKERLNKVFSKLTKSPEEVLSRIKKDCPAKTGYDIWQTNSFPSGQDYLQCARGMYGACTKAGCDETETIEFCRQFLTAVSKIHPSNISPNKAKNWKPPITYR